MDSAGASNDSHDSNLLPVSVPATTNDSTITTISTAATTTTAQEYIRSQLRLEADAREALPYQFDTCTSPLGPLRQSVFACLTCTPPLASSPAGICYSCSISCHGTHDLVELFVKRDFECDCGTTRFAKTGTPACTLRHDAVTGRKGGVQDAKAREANRYDHNFAGRFCGCGEVYDGEKEKGVMFQCLGLGEEGEGGCGQDWWHARCLLGMAKGENEPESKSETKLEIDAPTTDDVGGGDSGDKEDEDDEALPAGFPDEDAFEHLICYQCTNAFPWIKAYAAHPGWLSVVADSQVTLPAPASSPALEGSKKRKVEDDSSGGHRTDAKRARAESATAETAPAPDAETLDQRKATQEQTEQDQPEHALLPANSFQPNQNVSLFLPADFYPHLCHCSACYPLLRPHPQLLEPEPPAYEPPLSQPSSPALTPQQDSTLPNLSLPRTSSTLTAASEPADADAVSDAGSEAGSLLSLGEAALGSMPRVQALEGVRAYVHVREKVKAFLRPFAESGREVAEGDVVGYFARLREEREEGLRAATEGRL